MAGIGFELKKLYGENKGITRTVGAMGYSTITTIGPTVLIVGALIITNWLMGRWGIGEEEKSIFAGCLLYCFIIPLMISSIFDTVISRYVSDCLFSDKQEKIMPAVQGSTFVMSLIIGVIGIILGLALYFISELDLAYVLSVYFTLMGVGLTFSLSVFVTAVKSYKRITFAYFLGVVVIALVAILCHLVLGVEIGKSMLIGFASGFMCIAVHIYLYLHKAFPKGDGSYFEYFTSFRENKLLMFSGFFYILGIYVHNFVFWADSELQLVVRDILYCAPAYDMASFVAMLTSVSAMVIFVVRVETSFYSEYKGYCEAVIGNNYSRVEFHREKMSRTLINEVYFVSEFQIIITIIIMVLAMTFLPLIGISGITLDIYPVMALGYYTVFIMHILMIFLYYFDDQAGAAAVGFLFFVMTLVFTMLTRYLGIQFYGLGLVISGIISWIIAFVRLRRVLENVDYKMFCDNIKVGT